MSRLVLRNVSTNNKFCLSQLVVSRKISNWYYGHRSECRSYSVGAGQHKATDKYSWNNCFIDNKNYNCMFLGGLIVAYVIIDTQYTENRNKNQFTWHSLTHELLSRMTNLSFSRHALCRSWFYSSKDIPDVSTVENICPPESSFFNDPLDKRKTNEHSIRLNSESNTNTIPTANNSEVPESKQPNKETSLEGTDKENPLWRSKQSQPVEKKMQETAIFSGNSNLPLSKAIADCLGTKLGNIRLKRFADGEVNLQFLDSLRGKDVYIIQPTAPPVNENIIELLLMISTARRSSAKKITAVIPYYGYARQDRKLNSRVPISAADVARMIESMGVDRVISVDLHCGQIQGFFGPRVPVDNLEAQIVGLEYFAGKLLDKPVIVSPDAGGVYRARKFQEGLRARGATDVGIAMLIKQRLRPNEIERMDLVGSVDGCDVVIVDDMIDTAGTLCEAAAQLRKRGAKRVFAFATHGLFSGPALERIEKSFLEEVVVCDTIQQRPDIASSNRITHLSLAVLIADAIRRIHQKESLQQLFATAD